MANSFIENVNIVANATKTATGDVIEDAELARDTAVAAAASATDSAQEAKTSELLSKDWAQKGHNNPVDYLGLNNTPRYSSYHWSVESATNSEAGRLLVINDGAVSSTHTWSSSYIKAELDKYSLIGHNHDGEYEPPIGVKGTAFNKYFGVLADTVAEGNHTHPYQDMPVADQKTAYNKDFGSTADTVAEGNHNHSTLYMPLVQTNSAYNSAFGGNGVSPTVSRSDHFHTAGQVSYTPQTGSDIVGNDVQSAIDYLDTETRKIEFTEKTKLIAGMTDDIYTVINSGALQPNIISAGMTLGDGVKNAFYSNGVTINYPADPPNYIEGQYGLSVSVVCEANVEYAIGIAVDGVVINPLFRAEVGSQSGGTAGVFAVALTGWISNLVNGQNIQAVIYSTSSNNIDITSMTVTWAGQGEGAIISNGQTFVHNDASGRSEPDAHPISAITGLDTALTGKANVDGSDLQIFKVADGVDPSDAINKSQLDDVTVGLVPVPSRAGAIAILDSSGNLTDSDVLLTEKANLNGSLTEAFNVLDATADSEATSLGQMNTALSNKANLVHTHLVADINDFPTEMTPSAHVHTINEVTSLQDELDNRYVKPLTPVTNNFVSFGAGDTILDSGVSGESNLLVGEVI